MPAGLPNWFRIKWNTGGERRRRHKYFSLANLFSPFMHELIRWKAMQLNWVHSLGAACCVARSYGWKLLVGLLGQCVPSHRCITMCSEPRGREAAPGLSNERGGLTNANLVRWRTGWGGPSPAPAFAIMTPVQNLHLWKGGMSPVLGGGGRNGRMADFQQDVSRDLPLPSGSKGAAQGRCGPGKGFAPYSSFHCLFERPSLGCTFTSSPVCCHVFLLELKQML